MTRKLVVLSIAFVATILTGRAAAQTAPEGNAHPQPEMVAAESDALNHPFGEGEAPPRTVEQLRDFASGLELDPLRDLAVFNAGRVKILDTLARETVGAICGRDSYVDFVATGEEEPEKVAFDPLFTLIDLAVNPGSYVGRPFVHVNFLPLREEYLGLAFPDDPEKQERWKKLTRVAPSDAAQASAFLSDRHGGDPAYLQAIRETEAALELFAFGGTNFLLVPPERKDLPWAHISQLPESAPSRQAAIRLGDAWRAHDAPGVNAAAVELREALLASNPAVYPTTSRTIEALYNRAEPFGWGYWIYCLSLVSLLLAFGTGRRWLIALGVGSLVAAVALHGFGFVLRCIIAERFAIQNQFESMTGLSLFAAIVGLALMVVRRQWLFGAAAAATGFLALIVATESGIPGAQVGREAAILNTSVLLKYHVTTVLVSYGLITLGFVVSLFYLGVHYFGARDEQAVALAAGALGETAPRPFGAEGGDLAGGGPKIGRAKLLADLDTAQMTVLQLAFWTLGVGILLGAWWADHSWGRWWAFDPKETWALITWIVYLIAIHVRFGTGIDRRLATAWLSVVGFGVMLFTYFAVNLVLPGLHAYA
ncbi:MAG TPA: cytochrome c biogenesis protein CcsA [Phycisphaerales bacterium]|nr:cytochrome c biogenesis protein CcsA [Phycisphaerales bacterium]